MQNIAGELRPVNASGIGAQVIPESPNDAKVAKMRERKRIETLCQQPLA